MTKRQKAYQDILTACRAQPTDWLTRCNAEPGPHQNKLSRLAVRNALLERDKTLGRNLFRDISHVTEYGVTQRLSQAVRVF